MFPLQFSPPPKHTDNSRTRAMISAMIRTNQSMFGLNYSPPAHCTKAGISCAQDLASPLQEGMTTAADKVSLNTIHQQSRFDSLSNTTSAAKEDLAKVLEELIESEHEVEHLAGCLNDTRYQLHSLQREISGCRDEIALQRSVIYSSNMRENQLLEIVQHLERCLMKTEDLNEADIRAGFCERSKDACQRYTEVKNSGQNWKQETHVQSEDLNLFEENFHPNEDGQLGSDKIRRKRYEHGRKNTEKNDTYGVLDLHLIEEIAYPAHAHISSVKEVSKELSNIKTQNSVLENRLRDVKVSSIELQERADRLINENRALNHQLMESRSAVYSLTQKLCTAERSIGILQERLSASTNNAKKEGRGFERIGKLKDTPRVISVQDSLELDDLGTKFTKNTVHHIASYKTCDMQSPLAQDIENELLGLREMYERSVQSLTEKEEELGILKTQYTELERVNKQAHVEKDLRIAGLLSQLHTLNALKRKLHNKIMELKGNIRVFVRLRPAIGSELTTMNDTVVADSRRYSLFRFPDTDNEQRLIELYDIPSEHVSRRMEINRKWSFSFDRVFGPSTSQDELFIEVSPWIQSAVDGYKVCIFAHGQTGSGKTFSMQGASIDEWTTTKSPSSVGIIGRSVQYIFSACSAEKKNGWEWSMSTEIVEIYNETLKDLLSDEFNRPEIRLGTNGQPHLNGAQRVPVESHTAFLKLLQLANARRATQKTQRNEHSSRSHLVVTLRIDMQNNSTSQERHGVLNLVDLAGSERLKFAADIVSKDLMKETQAINKSLATLASVIQALANKDKHVPYRDSKLTFLLQPCLGGNAKTLMLCTLSPAVQSRHESLCSLRFAKKVSSCELALASPCS